MRSFLRFLIFITVLVAALVVVGGPLVTRPLIAARRIQCENESNVPVAQTTPAATS